MEDRPQWRRRAVEDLLEACHWPSWEVENMFLFLAETCHAFAFGLSWLREDLEAEELQQLESALLTKGLEVGDRALACRPWWWRDTANWNIVCNCGLQFAAMALAQNNPLLARRVRSRCLEGLQDALIRFAPDGGWVEGPGYWAFAWRYFSLLVDLHHWAGLSLQGLD